ncbi:MAG: hypothetical protein JWM21_796 [Acidobacteria bacterium]|nr:hypothetical protein [Acidobacteriota bacterium]
MNRKAFRFVAAPAIILLCCLAASQAQEAAATPKPEAPKQEVSATKRTLIKQILDLTNAARISEGMFDAQFDEMKKELPAMQLRVISSLDEFKRLSPTQQEEVRTRVKESSDRISKRLKEVFLQRIDLKQLVEEISYSIYDKHFSEGELTDLVTFYKSTTGQKVIAEMPSLFAESIEKSSEIVIPKVKEVVADMQKEQTSQLTKEIDAVLKSSPKSPKKTTSTRRRH